MQTRTVTLPDGHQDEETLFILPGGNIWAITKCSLGSDMIYAGVSLDETLKRMGAEVETENEVHS